MKSECFMLSEAFTNLVLSGHNVKPNHRLETVYITSNKPYCPVHFCDIFIKMSACSRWEISVALVVFSKSVLTNETLFLRFTFRRRFPERPRTTKPDIIIFYYCFFFFTQLYLQMFTLVWLVLLRLSLFTEVLLTDTHIYVHTEAAGRKSPRIRTFYRFKSLLWTSSWMPECPWARRSVFTVLMDVSFNSGAWKAEQV